MLHNWDCYDMLFKYAHMTHVPYLKLVCTSFQLEVRMLRLVIRAFQWKVINVLY